MKNSIYIISFLIIVFSISLEAQTPAVIPSTGKKIKILETETNYPPPPPPDFPDFPEYLGHKIIFFVHGLGGDIDSWVRASSATQNQIPNQSNHLDWKPRKAWAPLPTYAEGGSLSDAGNSLYTNMAQINYSFDPPNPLDNFIIAHSQGGLVSRQADVIMESNIPGTDRFFNGIVTFGTPHQGAMILNNSDVNDPNNKVQMFAEEACEELAAGPLVELAETNIFIDLFTNRNSIQELLNTSCDIISGAVPIAFQDFRAQITNDYWVGAPALDVLNQFNSPVYKVAFYGVEDAPLIWRTMSSFVGPDTPNSFDHFESDQDETLLIQTILPEIASYQADFDRWDARVQELEGFPYHMPCDWWRWIIDFARCALYDHQYWEAIDIRNAYNRGLVWFDNADANYKDVIGAFSTNISSQWYCRCEGPGGITEFPVNDPSDCDPHLNCWPFKEYTVNVTEEPSDGVVLANSARNFPGSIWMIELEGSNHQQMRNDINTKVSLITLYDGGYDDFFFTEEK